MIRDALSVLPTRPIVYIVPLIMVLVISFYYRDMYTKCTNIKQFRTSLNELLHSADAPAQFRLMDLTDFMWDRVRVVTNFKFERRNLECPFGWNWSSGERESLVASGLLTALIFTQQGTMVEYLELRSDEVAFRGAGSSLTPETAVFGIKTKSVNSSSVTLTLSNE
jgi:hypothetical protein